MLIVLLLSFSAGYLLNEEQALRRICKNLSYPHEGWLVMNNSQALWVLVGSCVLSIAKAIAWGKIVMATFPAWVGLALLLFSWGNILAVKQSKGLYYTPWLTLVGLGVVFDPLLFQVPFTAICVVWLLLRCLSMGLDAAILAGAITICWLGTGSEAALGLGGLWVTWYFSGRQSPFSARLIKYR